MHATVHNCKPVPKSMQPVLLSLQLLFSFCPHLAHVHIKMHGINHTKVVVLYHQARTVDMYKCVKVNTKLLYIIVEQKGLCSTCASPCKLFVQYSSILLRCCWDLLALCPVSTLQMNEHTCRSTHYTELLTCSLLACVYVHVCVINTIVIQMYITS